MRRDVYILCLIGLFCLSGHAQSDREIFEQMRKEMRAEFAEYQKQNEREYARYLRQTWQEYRLEKGIEPFERPKPDNLPPASPQKRPSKTSELIVAPKPDGLQTPPLPPIIFEEKKKEVGKYNVQIAFYGSTLQFTHNIEPCQLAQVREKQIADLWEKFGKQKNGSLFTDLITVKLEMRLNDWAFFCLLKQTARQLPQLKDDNTRTIFMHYALHTYGYDIKMGIIDKEVALLVPIQEKVYAYSYLPENGKKYYLFTAGEKPSATPVRTLPSLSRNKQRPFSLAITEPMLLAEDYRDTNRTYRDCSLNSPVNQNRISFFNDMPHTDLAVYADMPVDVAFAENTCQGLGSRIAPLSREDALNFLLHFTQSAFRYQTDGQQFGRERSLFPEETFYYPYSDCEDRAIFFSWLVRRLLKQEIVLLHYSDHVATGVRIEKEIPGSYIRTGDKRYLICDPTYIGADIGQCMPGYEKEKPRIIKLNQ